MDEITKLLVRTVIIYFILTVSMRIMGKRQLGEMELSELVTTLLLSEISAVPIVDFKIPLKRALIPVLLIISFEIIIPFISAKKRFIKKLVEGKPSYIIYRGELRLSEIKKNRISLDELICELREQGFFDISDIEYAILEPNGQLSILPKNGDTNAQNTGGMVHNLIINGEIIDFNLKLLNLDEKWLNEQIASLGVSKKDISLFGLDDCNNMISVISSNGKNSKIIKTPKSKKKNP
ncbi:MAG: DUF421 domain-containing protein [Ruminococcaceae bacterium]|nr:DUF421 domain-containing protein [Oscillospiraceae bacterium]